MSSSAPPLSELIGHAGFWLRGVFNHVPHALAGKRAERNDGKSFNHLSGAERKTLERRLKRMIEHCHMTAVPIE